MGVWKSDAKQDGCQGEGPAAKESGKAPFPGVTPGSGDVSDQMNPRRDRREDYTPKIQPREVGVKNS
jgi:hypothetical protein